MSEVRNSSGEWLIRLSRACESLLHPAVTDSCERGRQTRFLGVCLVAPLLLSAAFAQVLVAQGNPAVMISVVCLCFAGALSIVISVALSGRSRAAEAFGLLALSTSVGALVALAGGLASPMLLAVLALAVEPVFVVRSRRAAWLAVPAVAIALAPAYGALPLPDPMVPQSWHWIVPAAYANTLWARWASIAGSSQGETAAETEDSLEDMMPAVTLRSSAFGDVTSASIQARDILGVEPEFLLGGGFAERIHADDRSAWSAAAAKVTGGAPALEATLRLRIPAADDEPSGTAYAFFSAEIMKAAGKASGLVILLRRQDGMSRLQTALAEAEERLREAEIGRRRVLAAVSHELRTPLNAIIGFSDMLLQGIHGPLANERQREYVGLMRESGQHLLALANSMLDMVRLESGDYPIDPLPFNFQEAVEASLSMVLCQAEAKQIRLVHEAGHEIGTIEADRRAVQQILVNLLANAVKFTPQAGEVRIGAHRAGDRLDFWVSDNGIGIADDNLQRIGKPFLHIATDDVRQSEGAGLGLSIVKGLVERQKGSMSIESAPGRGTKVSIGLPVGEPWPEQRLPDAEIIRISPSKKRGEFDEKLRKTA